MEKQLSEMPVEELWELFPVILKEHNPQYKGWYEIEKRNVLAALKPEDVIRINHIGSSAVKGLVSKPTVDILLEIDSCCDIVRLTGKLKESMWEFMRQEDDPLKLIFCKGYTSEGFAEKVFHLHVRYFGDWDELYFRDYLAAYPDVAAEYGRLKLGLLEGFRYNRDGYTEAKSEFVLKYSEIAKLKFGDRYKLR